MLTIGGQVGPAATPGLYVRILTGCLIGFYVLLPLDRGFPAVPLFGRPLNPAIAATLVVLSLLVIQSRGAVLAPLRERYCVLQSLYACVLLVGALRAPSPPSALHWSLLYYCTFVVNYVVLRHVTRQYGSRWLSSVVVGVGLAAAAVTIAQGIFGVQLAWYDAWFEDYFARPPENYALPTARAAGTMNHPVLQSLLMALIVPYAFDLSSLRARTLALSAIVIAAGLTGSRTAVFLVSILAGGALAVYRQQALRNLPAIVAGVLLVLASLAWPAPDGRPSRLALLIERVGLVTDRASATERSRSVLGATDGLKRIDDMEPGARAEVFAALGISLRQEALREAVREMTQEWEPQTWILGRGSLTAAAIGTRIQTWFNTVDNVYLSVVYERGLAGLLLFGAAFVSFLVTTRRAAVSSVHWYAPVALAAAGFSFCWDAYSTFNILAVGSMAIVMHRLDNSVAQAHERRAAVTPLR